jgi:hypothetical protein
VVVARFGERYVNVEAPIDVAPEDNPTNEPEPDLIVLTRPSLEFDRNPQAVADLRLVIEISDSTLGFDLKTKAALYARAGIASPPADRAPRSAERAIPIHHRLQN